MYVIVSEFTIIYFISHNKITRLYVFAISWQQDKTREKVLLDYVQNTSQTLRKLA